MTPLTLLQKVLFVADAAKVSHEMVEDILGAPKHDLINRYLTTLADNDVPGGVSALSDVSRSNANVPLFAKLCIRKLRAALLLREKVPGMADDYTDEDTKFITDLAEKKTVTLSTLKALVEASHTIPASCIKVLPLEFLLLEEK